MSFSSLGSGKFPSLKGVNDLDDLLLQPQRVTFETDVDTHQLILRLRDK
jgi:hypothetical protein